MSGKDVFISLPKVYGKSLIYAVLSLVFALYKGAAIIMNKIEQKGSVVICVSPLVSLVMDQKAKFVPMGHKTEFVGEDQPDSMVL